MKKPRLSSLKIDEKGTKQVRSAMHKAKSIKITINVDADSLDVLKKLAADTEVPYQRLLNRLLREGLSKRSGGAEARLDRVERELKLLKKKLAA